MQDRFFYRILLPSLVTIFLFLASIFLYVIPNYRNSLMEKKRETIHELTNTAWSVMHKLNSLVSDSFDVAEAQLEAAIIIADMRYGEEFKDYFWITDTLPRMVMHPYRPQMNGMSLADFADPAGKKFFVEIVNLVKQSGDGYIDYKWQWKDDSLMVVPKLSYVKAFEPWGWIVGTGIYVEDVQREINSIIRQVVWISIIITLLIAALIAYLARRNYMAEMHRFTAQEKLKETLDKYKKLVEASPDGVMMTMEDEMVYCNPYLLELLGFDEKEAIANNQIFNRSMKSITDPAHPNHDTLPPETVAEKVTEQQLLRKDRSVRNVVVHRSVFMTGTKKGFIYTLKDVSKHKDIERELDLSMEKFKSIADLMNLGMFRCTVERNPRFTEINNIALKLLGFGSIAEIGELSLLDLLFDQNERRQLIRAIASNVQLKDKLVKIKNPDGSSTALLLSLFEVKDAYGKAVYYDGILVDAYDYLSRRADIEKSSVVQPVSTNLLLKSLKDLVVYPPICDLNTPASVASRLMTMRKCDLVLVADDKATVIGLVTHGDISRRIIAPELPVSTRVAEIMSAPVITLTDQEMVMDAFALMIQHKISYVIVHSTSNKQAGYISLTDLSEMRRDTPEFLINNIQQAGSVDEIAELMKQLPGLVSMLVETGTGSATSGRLISRISDQVTVRFIQDALQELGPAPVPFVFLILGSEGRREQTLATDQDNAIVYDDSTALPEVELKKYFLKLGEIVCTKLDRVGYPFCDGGVMAMTEQWCLSFGEITSQVSRWINKPNPKELLNVGIFFDFRPVFGDLALSGRLQDFCLKELRDKPVFMYNLVQATTSIKQPVNLRGQIVFELHDLHGEYFDVKKPLMTIVGIIRLWSLKYGLSERNTLERLYALRSVDAITDSFFNEFSEAVRYLMYLRIRNQLRQHDAGDKTGNYISPSALPEIDRTMLKKILSAISAHQSRLATEFRIT
jgi:PAS domain S-box-containing protein